MVIKEHHLEKIIKDNSQFLSILIYGPNEGLVKNQIEKLAKNYLPQGDYEEISFNGKELDDDPSSLEAIIRSVSMFFKNKIVIADAIKDKHLSIIEEVVLKAPEQALLVIRESSLSKSSKIRKFFDEMPKLRHEVEVENPKTKVKSTVTFSGLSDFFVSASPTAT